MSCLEIVSMYSNQKQWDYCMRYDIPFTVSSYTDIA